MAYVYEVGELVTHVKLTLLESLSFFEVVGEVSDLSVNKKSGHAYFSLKDCLNKSDNAAILCTCWKNNLPKFADFLQEGKVVKISGKMGYFASNSRVYVNVLGVLPKAEGDIIAYFEQQKAKLQKQGFFDTDSKRSITKFPQCIGLITSLDGVVVEDIKATLSNRMPCKLVVYDANVQGKEAAETILQGLHKLNKQYTSDSMDFIIIARGGGSKEDLWYFNDENLVKAVANSSIPILTAIGHQPNTTLVDLAADYSCVTPTAAVIHIPYITDLSYNLASFAKELNKQIGNKITFLSSSLELSNKMLKSPKQYAETQSKCLADYQLRFRAIVLDRIKDSHMQLQILSNSLPNLGVVFNYHDLVLKNAKKAVLDNFNRRINHIENFLYNANIILEGISFHNSLKRGFAIIYKGSDIISSKEEITAGEYKLQFQDGDKLVKLEI